MRQRSFFRGNEMRKHRGPGGSSIPFKSKLRTTCADKKKSTQINATEGKKRKKKVPKAIYGTKYIHHIQVYETLH